MEKTMEIAIGTKVIGFERMYESTFLKIFKKELLAKDAEDREGYHVQYSNPNGSYYDSWTPKDVFEEAYRPINKGMTFGDAIYFLKAGRKVARSGWNGKGMWLKLVEMDYYSIIEKKVGFNMGDGHDAWNLLPWIGMKTADNKFVPWLASQTDILAEDWCIIE